MNELKKIHKVWNKGTGKVLVPKKCEVCKKEFLPKYRVTQKYWEDRKYCSYKCSEYSKKGVPNSSIGKERKTLLEKFWSKVVSKSTDECWEWNGSKEKQGYGILNLRITGKYLKAHRASWEIHFGEIPNNLCVCHKCDNRSCVNPSHLFLGIHQENMADMTVKKRYKNTKGELNGRSKLTKEQVVEILNMKNKGISQQKIANYYNVSQVRISMIFSGKSWKHLQVEI